MNEIELYRKHRPTSLKGLYGQTDAVRVLSKMLKSNTVPHAIRLTGPSGTGKTTTALILKDRLQCSDRDFVNINVANSRGIDTIREIDQQKNLSPMGGKCRIWLLDEVHRATPDSMSALLNLLEFPPFHVYFILATTHDDKLLPTIKTRCTEIRFKSLTAPDMKALLQEVCDKERATISDTVADRLIECSEGSARMLLVDLHKVIKLEDEEQQLNAILSSNTKRSAFDLAKALLWEKPDWKKIAAIIEALDEGENWEGVRYLILACASKEVLKGGVLAKKGFAVLCAFESAWYDSKKNGLVRACWEVFGK